MKPNKYYVVWQGRKTGIFTCWEDCKQQVEGFKGGRYKAFKTRREAEEALGLTKQLSLLNLDSESPSNPLQSTASGIIANSIAVDASCLGNPGDVEYRGVDTTTGNVLFHKGPMANGTNNIGEFLAIVHALAYLKNQNKDIPIYSDSATAIQWVKNQKVKTTLQPDSRNQEIFDLLNWALKWLDNHRYSNPILKWDTAVWGEIPADFGRK